jgi:hypothetical protein
MDAVWKRRACACMPGDVQAPGALLLVVGHQSENVADLLSPGYCYILQLICVDPASSARLLFRTDISFTQNVTASMLQRPRRSDRVPGCVVLDGQLPNAYSVR